MIQDFVSDGLYRMVKSCISTEYTMYILNVRLYYYNTVIVMMVIYPQIQVDLKKTSSNLMNFFF